MFEFAPHCKKGTRNNFYKLKNPFRKINMGQKTIFYVGPSVWSSLPNWIKKANSLNTFKNNVKKHYLTWIIHVYMWICVQYLYLYVCTFVGVLYIYISVFSFDLSILMFFFSRLPFSLIFALTWGITMKIRGSCPSCAMPVIVDAIHICPQ